MPQAAPRPCSAPGCKALVHDGSGRCAAHPRPAWSKSGGKATKRKTGRWLQAERDALFRSDPLCAECKRHGRVRLATIRDHIAPLAEGGLDERANTQGLCDECNEVKSEAERKRGCGRAAG